MLAPAEYRALLRRSRVFLSAARREDYGIAQLEALADGCLLVTTPSPGPYAALPLARELDPRLVGRELAIRTALDDPRPDYAERAAAALAPFSPAAVDRVVAEQLLPRLFARLRSGAKSSQERVLATCSGRQPGAAGGGDAVLQELEVLGRVGVGVDEDHHARLGRGAGVATRSCRGGPARR